MSFDESVTSRHAQPRFMWLTLKALEQLGGSGSIPEINEVAISLGGFSEEEQAIRQNNRYTKVEYGLAWSRTHLKGAGLAENVDRGLWVLTPAARDVTEADMPAAHRRARDAFRAERAKRRRSRRD